MKTLLLLPNIGMILLGIALLVTAVYLSRRRARTQQLILQTHAAALCEGRWFRIRYASPVYYQRWLKIFPWNDSGILHVTPQSIRLYLEHDQIIDIPVAQCHAHWHGQKFFPNGFVHWFSLQHAGAIHYLTSETGALILNSQTSTADIFTQLSNYLGDALDVAIPYFPPVAFAIEKNPAALTCVVVFFILLGYFLIDNFFVLQEDYLNWPKQYLFIIGGLLALIGAFLLMERHKVPTPENTVIALLLCAATVGAMYPGLRRLNQLTDSDGLQPYTYTFSETRLLIPQDTNLPRLAIAMGNRERDYWLQFKTGDSYEVLIRNGGLGFYQIDMSPIYSRMRDFYQLRAAIKNHASDTTSPATATATPTPTPVTPLTQE